MNDLLLSAETNHCVDDVPSHLYAMSEFINYGMFTVMNCYPSADGRTLQYQVRNYEQKDLYLRRARFIITAFHLPLTVSLEHQVGSHGIKTYIIVKYTGK